MPGIDIPIKTAQVIAWDVVPIIRKFDALPTPRRASVAFDGATLDLLRHQLQALETVEGQGVEFHNWYTDFTEGTEFFGRKDKRGKKVFLFCWCIFSIFWGKHFLLLTDFMVIKSSRIFSPF